MNPSEITAEYIGELTATLQDLPVKVIVQIAALLAEARARGRTVLLFGNGGSSAIASHLAVDLNKTAIHPDHPRIRAIALTDNVPLMTAWANDTAYANIFVEQMRNFIQPGDVAVAISSSGRSPNIVEAVRYARAAGAITVGLAGFDGGELRDLVDVCLIVPNQHYGQIEDAHQAVAHMVTALLRSGADLSAALPVSGAPPGLPATGGG